MRTPNTSCIICTKPLYRRPYEIAKVRYAACMQHRSVAQKVVGITDRQLLGLSLGREKGTNHRVGYKHHEHSKLKCAEANKNFWKINPEQAAARGEKTRGDKHYKWKGGISNLNKAVRVMTENRKWMDAVKARDKKCLRCGSTDNLEAHHLRSLAGLLGELKITSVDDARKHAGVIWDLSNGETLCQSCHYTEHGRTLPCK